MNNIKKPYLWLYWDNIDGKETPSYIELCYDSVIKNCSNSFNIIRLNKNNIFNFLPEYEKYKYYIDKLQIAHKVDVYRIMLLYKYGGLYLDSDTIVIRDPIEIYEKLNDYDFVGFGCTGEKCTYGYGTPSNGIMASRENTLLMKNVLENILNKITTKDSFDYFDLGKYILWEEIQKINNYTYYHYPNKYDGTRDKYGKWIQNYIIFSDIPIEYDDEDNMLFFTMYNSDIKEIKNLSKDELLNKNWNFTKYLKKALKN